MYVISRKLRLDRIVRCDTRKTHVFLNFPILFSSSFETNFFFFFWLAIIDTLPSYAGNATREPTDKRTDKNYRNTSQASKPDRGMENLFHDGTSLTKWNFTVRPSFSLLPCFTPSAFSFLSLPFCLCSSTVSCVCLSFFYPPLVHSSVATAALFLPASGSSFRYENLK